MENPIFDVVKENGGTYQNKHAGLMKTVMRKKQTSDVFYKLHGNRARAYTRETSEIRTRLDRIYAKDTNSQLVWHSHKLDHTYVNYVDSDHIPVVVEAGPLGESKSKKAGKCRINTEILYTQDARREVLKIITQAKKNIPSCNPYEGKLRWERIKEKAYGYLIEKTKKHKKEKERSPGYAKMRALEGALRNLQNSTDPPSMTRAERIQELKKNLKEEATKIGPAGPKLADNRYGKEEECTTQFFKKIRPQHANMNINELYVIDDWDNREEEQPETTTDEEELLIQASCYYRWLYKPKKIQQEDMDTMLDTLREKPIPDHIAKRTEGPITKEQIKTAIRKLGNNKSPGPDGLPAEFYKLFEDIIIEPLHDAIKDCWTSGCLTETMKQ